MDNSHFSVKLKNTELERNEIAAALVFAFIH